MALRRADGEAGWHTQAHRGDSRPAALSCGGCRQAAPRTRLAARCCGGISCPHSPPAHGRDGRSDPTMSRAAPARHVPAPPGRTSAARACLRPLPGTGCAPGPGRTAAGREGSRESRPKEPGLAQPALPGCSGRGRGLRPAGPRLHLPRGSAGPGRGEKGMVTSQRPGQGTGERGPLTSLAPRGRGAWSYHSIRLEGMEKRGLITALAPRGRGARCQDSARLERDKGAAGHGDAAAPLSRWCRCPRPPVPAAPPSLPPGAAPHRGRPRRGAPCGSSR